MLPVIGERVNVSGDFGPFNLKPNAISIYPGDIKFDFRVLSSRDAYPFVNWLRKFRIPEYDQRSEILQAT
jgi:hypothetical protein